MIKNFKDFKKVDGTKKTYELTNNLVWPIGKESSSYVLILKKGTKFDITVPFIFQWFLSPHDKKILPAAAIHDELLKQGYDDYFSSAEFRRACLARDKNFAYCTFLFYATLYYRRIKFLLGFNNE